MTRGMDRIPINDYPQPHNDRGVRGYNIGRIFVWKICRQITVKLISNMVYMIDLADSYKNRRCIICSYNPPCHETATRSNRLLFKRLNLYLNVDLAWKWVGFYSFLTFTYIINLYFYSSFVLSFFISFIFCA